MKANKIMRWGLGLIALFIAAFFMIAGDPVSGVTIAMAAIAGETVTSSGVDTESPALNVDSVLETITEISPSRAPLDTLMRRVGRSMKATDWKVENYDVVERPFQDTTAALYTTVADAKSAEIPVSNIKQWTNDHTVLVQGSDTMLLITAINYATNKITVTSIDNGTTQPDVPTILSGAKLTRMAPALAELQADTDSFAEIPTKDYNYCQKYAAKISMSFVQQIQEQQVKWGFDQIQRLRMKKLREEIELNNWAGTLGVTQRSRNSKLETVYTMGGIKSYVGRHLEYGTGGTNRTINNDTMNGLMKDIMTGSAGSETKFAFYGSDAGKYLYGITDWAKLIKEQQKEVTPGLTFTQYIHNYGKLMLIYHPLFDQLGWSEQIGVIDMEYLVKANMFPLKSVKLLNEETGVEDSKAIVVKETSSLLTLYPDVHAWITPKA
jgi:hypothetical protein